MVNWKYVKIGDVCTVERGGSPRPIDKFVTDDPNGINWIKIGDTDDSMYITRTAQKIIPEGMKKSRYVQPGDFLLSNSMSFGHPYILKIDGCIHDGWLVLRDNNGIFDKKFLYYYLSSPSTYQKFKNMAVGGVVNNLNSEMVRGVTVPMPSMAEQLEIVAALDKVIELISLRKEQLAKLDELIKARFVEMFGACKSTMAVNDVCLIITDGTHQPPKFQHRGIPFILVSNIAGNKVTYETEKFISEETYAELVKRTPIEIGDVLLSTVGSYGHPAVVLQEKKFLFQRHIAYLKPDRNLINSQYLHSALLAPDTQRQIEEKVKGIAQKTLNLSEIRKIIIPVPGMDLQNEFAGFVKQVDKSKLTVQQSLDKLEVLKNALMQEYFGKGERNGKDISGVC